MGVGNGNGEGEPGTTAMFIAYCVGCVKEDLGRLPGSRISLSWIFTCIGVVSVSQDKHDFQSSYPYPDNEICVDGEECLDISSFESFIDAFFEVNNLTISISAREFTYRKVVKRYHASAGN